MWWEMVFIHSNVYQYINIQFTEIILEAQIILYRSHGNEDWSNHSLSQHIIFWSSRIWLNLLTNGKINGIQFNLHIAMFLHAKYNSYSWFLRKFHYSSPYFGPQGSDPMEPDVYICIRLKVRSHGTWCLHLY